ARLSSSCCSLYRCLGSSHYPPKERWLNSISPADYPCPHGVCDNLALPITVPARRSMLNTLWLAFFIVASVSGLYQWIALDDPEVFSRIVLGLFDMAELSVQIMILLFGTLTLWLGFLRIAEA